MSWLFSQALVAEYSGGGYSDGEPCAQLSVMPTAQPFWHRDKPMDASRFSRFGVTSQLLTADHGAALLTWFRADFLARTSPSPAMETDSTGSGQDSGARWPGSFARYSRDTSTWKTPQCSLLADLEEFSETWPNYGSMRNGECWERPTLELRTSESGSGFLPTPVAIDTGSRFNRSASEGAALRPTLGAMARFDLWPTPLAHDATRGYAHRVGRFGTEHGGRNLNDWVAKWPTPTVKGNYNRKGLSSKSGDGLATAVMTWPTPRASDYKGPDPLDRRPICDDDLPTRVLRSAGGQLNPEWVEWLMGWPIGWTALQPLAMDKFREWQRQHGDSCNEESNADTSSDRTTDR